VEFYSNFSRPPSLHRQILLRVPAFSLPCRVPRRALFARWGGLVPWSLVLLVPASPMRAAFGIHARVGKAQPLHRPPAHQVLRHNLFRVLRLHVPVPNRIGIHHYRGPMLALVQAAGLVDAHLRAQPGLARKLLQARVQSARSVACARGSRRIGRASVVTDKDVSFKWGQAENLLSPINSGAAHSRLTRVPHISSAAADEMWESTNPNPRLSTQHQKWVPHLRRFACSANRLRWDDTNLDSPPSAQHITRLPHISILRCGRAQTSTCRLSVRARSCGFPQPVCPPRPHLREWVSNNEYG
jgi:hypothetical protein